MSENLELKLAFVLITLGVVLVAGWPVLRRGPVGERALVSHLDFGESLATGVFLGVGLIHMLGDAALDYAEAGIDYPLGELVAGLVILALLFLEHQGARIAAARGADSTSLLALLATLVLVIHSFLVGAALGTSSELAMTLIIFTAIIAHKWAAAFALALKLQRSALPRATTLLAFWLFALALPLGAGFGAGIEALTASHPLFEPSFSALAAGTFLYLALLHGLALNQLISRCHEVPHFALAGTGFSLMALVALWT